MLNDNKCENFTTFERQTEICNRLLDYISEMCDECDLYLTLKDSIGMTDDEIRAAGFDIDFDED